MSVYAHELAHVDAEFEEVIDAGQAEVQAVMDKIHAQGSFPLSVEKVWDSVREEFVEEVAEIEDLL